MSRTSDYHELSAKISLAWYTTVQYLVSDTQILWYHSARLPVLNPLIALEEHVKNQLNLQRLDSNDTSSIFGEWTHAPTVAQGVSQ